MKYAHAYLNDAEHRELDRLMLELDYTASAVLRLGLRVLAGMPIPRHVRDSVNAAIREGNDQVVVAR